jgi:predicted transposase/invertase (TIGR01784 family)
MRNNENEAMSPIADPVFGAIFDSVEHAGLAAKSLFGSILAKDSINIKEVVSVTSQKTEKLPEQRGYRIDVCVLTDDGKRLNVEVQVSPDKTIHQRNLLAASLIYSNQREGTTPIQAAKKMNTIIAINILDYYIRDNGTDILQPAKICYTKPPVEIAVPEFTMYSVQLPQIYNETPDWDDDFYCWAYCLKTAKDKVITVEEVIDMTPELTNFANRNDGFMQFRNRYDFVSDDKKVREEYFAYQMQLMSEQGIYEKGGDDKEKEIEASMIENGLTREQIDKILKKS